MNNFLAMFGLSLWLNALVKLQYLNGSKTLFCSSYIAS